MRLIDKNEEPTGGKYYIYEDSQKNEFRVNGYHMGWRKFMQDIRQHMKNNNVTIPEDLEAYVEDQICMRQPKGKCRYSGAGDKLAKTVHIFAGGIDKAASVLGINSGLEKKARGCSGCAKRRVKLNKGE